MRRIFRALIVTVAALASGAARADLNLQFSINNSSGLFTANHIQILNQALSRVEAMWERAITGYQAGINVGPVPISVRATTGGLASANFSTTVNQGGFTVTTSGFININVNEIEN